MVANFDYFLLHYLTTSPVLYWRLSCPLSSNSGRLHRLVGGLPEVSSASGWASATEVRSVLWVHPGQLQPGSECGPQSHVVPQLWPGPQRLRGAHFLRWHAYEQGGGCHLVQARGHSGRWTLFLCLTVGQRRGNAIVVLKTSWCILHYKKKTAAKIIQQKQANTDSIVGRYREALLI